MVTRGGGGSRQTVTRGDKGGRGVKNRDFYGDILFEWPPGSLFGVFLKLVSRLCLLVEHRLDNIVCDSRSTIPCEGGCVFLISK